MISISVIMNPSGRTGWVFSLVGIVNYYPSRSESSISFIVDVQGSILFPHLTLCSDNYTQNIVVNLQDCGFYSFVQKLMYKAEWYGREIVKVSRWFPLWRLSSHYPKEVCPVWSFASLTPTQGKLFSFREK